VCDKILVVLKHFIKSHFYSFQPEDFMDKHFVLWLPRYVNLSSTTWVSHVSPLPKHFFYFYEGNHE
jgi:hypothetical protein